MTGQEAAMEKFIEAYESHSKRYGEVKAFLTGYYECQRYLSEIDKYPQYEFFKKIPRIELNGFCGVAAIGRYHFDRYHLNENGIKEDLYDFLRKAAND